MFGLSKGNKKAPTATVEAFLAKYKTRFCSTFLKLVKNVEQNYSPFALRFFEASKT
jgi:hypothetical protein